MSTCLDRVEVDKNIFKLLKEKEARSHTLAARDGVFGRETNKVTSVKQDKHGYSPHSLPELPTSWKYC